MARAAGRVVVAVLVAILVSYLAVTPHHIQQPVDREAGLQLSPQIAPGRSPRRGY